MTRGLTLVLFGLFAATVAASAETGASRIVDRTLLCATRQSGGIYEIEAGSYSGTREGRSKWAKLPFAVATTGHTSTTGVLQNSLVWISAGRPHAETSLGDYRDVGGSSVETAFYGTLGLNRRLCRTVSTRIPLTSVGLTGGRAGQLGEIFDCDVPRRVLVRVRAVFESPTMLKGRNITAGHPDPCLLTTTPVREARLAVRTQSGKPLVYATVAASGRSTLHTGKSCFGS